MVTMNDQDQRLIDELNRTIRELQDEEYKAALRANKNRLNVLKNEIQKCQALIKIVVKEYTELE